MIHHLGQSFTGYERDGETGLDYAQARYFASGHGRFSSPDDFVNSTHVGNPQSWNLYVYVGNNPYGFVDPDGKKARVTVNTDKKKKTGTITIDASFGVYVEKGEYSQEEIQKQVELLKKQITETYSSGAGAGVTSGDGFTYTISVNVNVQVFGSEAAAEQAGSSGQVDNIVGLVKDRQLFTHSDGSRTSAIGYNVRGESFDRLVVATGAPVARNNIYAHEFGHLLGVLGHFPRGTEAVMAQMQPHITYLTARDFDATLGKPVRNHERGKVAVAERFWSKDGTIQHKRYRYENTTTQTVRAPSVLWDWNY